jgi:hypothetical protein
MFNSNDPLSYNVTNPMFVFRPLLYYTEPYPAILCCTILYYIIPHNTTILDYTRLYSTIQCYTVHRHKDIDTDIDTNRNIDIDIDTQT